MINKKKIHCNILHTNECIMCAEVIIKCNDILFSYRHTIFKTLDIVINLLSNKIAKIQLVKNAYKMFKISPLSLLNLKTKNHYRCHSALDYKWRGSL